MPDTQSKTLIPLLILRYLEENTDQDHPASREKIEQYLDTYGLTIERKAFFRHIDHLNELEWVNIQRVAMRDSNGAACAGFYCNDRIFTDQELRIMMDALSGSRYLSQWETEDLIERLSLLSTKYFQRKINAYQFVGQENKTDNETLFYNLDIIDEAIVEGKQIRFNLISTDKNGEKKASVHKLERTSPIRYFVKDQRYYLIGVINFRDKCYFVSHDLSTITDVEKIELPADPVTAVPGFERGVDWKKFLREHPSLDNLRGKPELCTFHCKRWKLDELQGHFGNDLRIFPVQHSKPTSHHSQTAQEERLEDLLSVSVITDPYAAMRFAWDHPEGLWLIAPPSANQALRWRLKSQLDYYDRLEERIGAGVPEKVFKDRQEKDLNYPLTDAKKNK